MTHVELFEVHPFLGTGRDGPAGSVAGIDDAPDSPVGTIHAFRIGPGVLVAGIFVIPIGDPKRAVRSDLFADWPEPAIGGGEQILVRVCFEARAIWTQDIMVNRALMNVP